MWPPKRQMLASPRATSRRVDVLRRRVERVHPPAGERLDERAGLEHPRIVGQPAQRPQRFPRAVAGLVGLRVVVVLVVVQPQDLVLGQRRVVGRWRLRAGVGGGGGGGGGGGATGRGGGSGATTRSGGASRTAGSAERGSCPPSSYGRIGSVASPVWRSESRRRVSASIQSRLAVAGERSSRAIRSRRRVTRSSGIAQAGLASRTSSRSPTFWPRASGSGSGSWCWMAYRLRRPVRVRER